MGGFFFLFLAAFFMPVLERWVELFFAGNRLAAEVSLLAYAFSNPDFDLSSELLSFSRSFGFISEPAINSSVDFDIIRNSSLQSLSQQYQLRAQEPAALPALINEQPFYPDPLLLFGLSYLMPRANNPEQRNDYFQRLGCLLSHRFPSRPDLILQLIAADAAFAVLKSLPDQALPVSSYYGNTHCALFHLQALWSKGRYQALHHTYIHYILSRRWFPHSDFLLRGFTIIARIERTDQLFRFIYARNHHELQVTTISNMLFTALGLERLDHGHINNLVSDYRRLTPPPAQKPTLALSVSEKPVLAIVSADLRLHPVGRFWLPIARELQHHFKLVHLAFNPLDQDSIRSELISISHQWHPLDVNNDFYPLLSEIKPHLLLDLGGHTADNRPGVLNHRFAPVQATYLGFYGPSYAANCDWWILDNAIARRVNDSYPGSEPIWALPGPSLCFDPIAHGLPPLDKLRYTEPNHACIGSFNHTRKLTDTCINRFASVLNNIPNSTLLFRSHSFYDHGVRRWFLQRFIDAAVDPAQLQPIPYAASGAESLLDYGRIHLHLDTYPVCGTTTTLDSMAMGIPVLTCPNHLYAGAISAALIEQAGFSDWICNDPADLSAMAAHLADVYRTAASRRALAQQVRSSPVCNTHAMPKMFAAQLKDMLKASSLSYIS